MSEKNWKQKLYFKLCVEQVVRVQQLRQQFNIFLCGLVIKGLFDVKKNKVVSDMTSLCQILYNCT